MKNTIIITYLIYIISFESLILGGTAYLIVVHDWSQEWMILAIILGFSCYKPVTWYALMDGKNQATELE